MRTILKTSTVGIRTDELTNRDEETDCRTTLPVCIRLSATKLASGKQ